MIKGLGHLVFLGIILDMFCVVDRGVLSHYSHCSSIFAW